MFPLDFAHTDEWTLPAHHIRDELLKLRDSGTERLLRRLDVAGHGLDSVMVVAATEGSASLTDNTTAMGTCKGCCNARTYTCARRVHFRQQSSPGTYWLESIHVRSTTPSGIDSDSMLVP